MGPEPATEAGRALLNEHSRRPPITDDGDPCAGERGVSRDHLRKHIRGIEAEAAKIERDAIRAMLDAYPWRGANWDAGAYGRGQALGILDTRDWDANRSSLISEESPDPTPRSES